MMADLVHNVQVYRALVGRGLYVLRKKLVDTLINGLILLLMQVMVFGIAKVLL